MAIAATNDQTRIFIDHAALTATMTPNTLQRHLAHENLNAEVFQMAGRVGIDCLTIELFEVATLLKKLGII